MAEPDSAQHYWQYALALTDSLLRVKSNRAFLHYAKGDLLNFLATYQANHGALDKAREPFELALKERETVDDSLGIAQCYNNLAFFHYRSGRTRDAIDLLFKSLKISIALKDSTAIAYNYHNIGQLQLNSGNLPDAEVAFTKSLVIRRALEEPNPARESLNSLAQYYRMVGRPKEALPLVQESIAISVAIGDSLGMAQSWESLAHTLESLNDLPGAESSMRQALTVYERFGDLDAVSNGLLHMAGYALRRGASSEAIILSDRGVAIAKDQGAIKNLSNGYSLLAKIYKSRFELEHAYKYEVLYFSVRDSLKQMDDQKQLAKTTILFEQERERSVDSLANRAEALRQERAIALERQMTIKKTNVSYAVAGVGGVFIVTIATFFTLVRRRRRYQHARASAQLQTQVFRAQVNPHFIHGALQSINDFVQTNEAELASSFLTRFARLMRAVLENARKDEVPLAADLAVVQDYLELEKVRTADGFKYSIEVEPDIDAEGIMVPPMLLQPYTEQAIWSRLANKSGFSHLVIRVQQRKGRLVLLLEDDGEANGEVRSGSESSPAAEGASITEARLALLSKQGGEEASVTKIALPKGQCVEIILPLSLAA